MNQGILTHQQFSLIQGKCKEELPQACFPYSVIPQVASHLSKMGSQQNHSFQPHFSFQNLLGHATTSLKHSCRLKPTEKWNQASCGIFTRCPRNLARVVGRPLAEAEKLSTLRRASPMPCSSGIGETASTSISTQRIGLGKTNNTKGSTPSHSSYRSKEKQPSCIGFLLPTMRLLTGSLRTSHIVPVLKSPS